MQIYVVKPGDTLFSIGRALGLAPGFLARYNGLLEPYRLAVGQSLLVLYPEQTVTVQPGDTLTSIAASAGTDVASLYRMNPNLSGSDRIYPGQILVTQLEQAAHRPAVVSGYAYPNVSERVLRGILPYAGALAPFTYGFTPEGALVPMDDERLLALAGACGVQPLLHLSTLTAAGAFSAAQAAALLRDPALQQTLAANVLQTMLEKGSAGLDVDFEYLGRDLAEPYAAFIQLLRDTLAPYGLPLITALAPKTSAAQPGTLYEGHNYASLSTASDAVLLMTYEWGYKYGPPMAVAPLNKVRQVVEYALTEIPSEKILLGVPNYGYDWILPFMRGESQAVTIGHVEAVQIAINNSAVIEFDETAQSPYFTYEKDNVRHEVWFEDVRSLSAKYSLIKEYNLRGMAVWQIMRLFRAMWILFDDFFEKRE